MPEQQAKLVPARAGQAGPRLHSRVDRGAAAAPARALRILVADDHRDSAATLSMMLQIMGGDVRTAHDGVEAVRAVGEFRPDVALLDIGMPNMNGHDAARKIRKQPWGKGIALIALTGWGEAVDRRRSYEAGFDQHLVKPVPQSTLAELLVALSRRVSRKRARG